MDREEFFRLKKVSGKKERDAQAEELERQKAKRKASDKENGGGTEDVLGAGEDEDVIF